MDKGNTKPAGTLVDRRRFLEFAGAGGAALILSRSSKASGAAPRVNTKLPNFVIIFTDDQGYNDLGCYGSPTIKTPHLDKMAAEGLKFTDFYVAASVCTPSRAALMTGCYPRRVSLPHVLFPNTRIGINPDEITIAEILKGQGYATMCIGKWHLGHLPPFLPTRHGFAHYFGLPYSNDMRPETNPRRYPPLPLIRDENIIEENPDQSRLTERYTDEAIRFISENKGRPFFLYMAHYAVHTPIMAKEDIIDKYKAKPSTPEHNNATYAAMIQSMDEAVGRVMDKLEELNIADHTIVVFMSDNGGLLGKTNNTPLRGGKAQAYEGGIREPMIIKWPGIAKAGSVCSEPVISTDFYPTILEIVNIAPKHQQHIDGISLAPLLRQRGPLNRDAIYWHYPHYHPQNPYGPFGAIRKGHWKLIEYYEDMNVELYNLKDDLSEQTDLAQSEPAKRDELGNLLKAWRQSVNAQMPTPNPNYTS